MAERAAAMPAPATPPHVPPPGTTFDVLPHNTGRIVTGSGTVLVEHKGSRATTTRPRHAMTRGYAGRSHHRRGEHSDCRATCAPSPDAWHGKQRRAEGGDDEFRRSRRSRRVRHGSGRAAVRSAVSVSVRSAPTAEIVVDVLTTPNPCSPDLRRQKTGLIWETTPARRASRSFSHAERDVRILAKTSRVELLRSRG